MAELPTVVAENGRVFTCFPAAVLVIPVNEAGQVLLFSKDQERWVTVAGGIEDNETVLDAAFRELREEAGPEISAEPVGVVHTHTFHYDRLARNMISIYYVVRYLGGEVKPGDDMAGASYAWRAPSDVSDEELLIPHGQVWILERAAAMAGTYSGHGVSFEYAVED